VLAVLLVSCRAEEPNVVEPRTGLRFVLIQPGQFVMGSPSAEPGRQRDEISHNVVISRSFYISATEVTQGQWQKIMGYNPSTFRKAGMDAPVEQVSWNEIQVFLARLNAPRNGKFRLPTEAEWEYTCRAGTTTAYAFGDRISPAQANYDGRYPLPGQDQGRYRGATTRVGSFEANAWGVFDMHGNVWEWCADEYCDYPSKPSTDPFNTCSSKLNVIRGGSWYFGADSARSAMRYTHEPQLKGFSIGFRVVRER
jgi:formylglycine-generating enzyme required for sulfatase activity